MSEFTSKNIWVFIETDEGKAKSVGLELLNPGRMLAEKAGEKLIAVILGKDNAEAVAQVQQYGADQDVYKRQNIWNHTRGVQERFTNAQHIRQAGSFHELRLSR